MIPLQGKYNSAKVFTDNVDSETIGQIINFLNLECIKDAKIRIMPDCHAGKNCVVGTTMTITDNVIPGMIGVDIGCGMYAIKLEETDMDLKKLDEIVNTRIPSGGSMHDKAINTFTKLNDMYCRVDKDLAYRSIGTLGGGNHFIEVDRDTQGNLWLVIHSGSRHVGTEVCMFYQKTGYKVLREKFIEDKIDATIPNLQAKGLTADIENTIKVIKMQYPPYPEELAYLEGDLFNKYLEDMRIAQEYAQFNRKTMANCIINGLNLHIEDEFDTPHNYIDVDNMILHKGSISAQKGERSIIPMNMRDGSLLCIGKGNEDWNYSAPHGAGRMFSRADAKELIDLEEYKKSMEGIYTSSVMESTIDESPMVYKPIEEIMENIKDTVEVTEVIKPIYNYKAH